MAQNKKQNFMIGTVILTVSTLLVKVLGLLFSIPLANLISTQSMSYFYTAYDIFTVFLMLSTTGLPVAVSRMVGTAYSQNRKKEADGVFKAAFGLFFSLGLFGALAMFFGADWFAESVMSVPGAGPAIRALAPTMLFISVMSAIRGYFQGKSNMVPTAVSQSIEAVSKVIIGLGLAAYLLKTRGSDDAAATGAVLGVSISAFLGTVYLIIYTINHKRRDRLQAGDPNSAATGELFVTLIKFAVPITLGSCFLSLLDMVDSAILMNRLESAAGFSAEAAESIKGLLGHARKFFDLPGAFVVPLSTSLLPVLSGAVATRDEGSVRHITSTSLRLTFLISIPASVGMCIFSGPICNLLLAGNPEAAEGTAPLLKILSLAIAFNCALLTTNAIIQAFGHPSVPVIHMAIGGIVKIALSYLLIGIPEINGMGSAASTVVSYLLMMILNLISVRKYFKGSCGVMRSVAPILLSSAVMGGVSYFAYWLLSLALPSSVAVLPAIIIAVLCYAALIVLTRAVTYDDVMALPKGSALVKILHMKPKE